MVHVCVASSVGVVSIVRLTVKDGSVEVSTVDEITLPGEGAMHMVFVFAYALQWEPAR